MHKAVPYAGLSLVISSGRGAVQRAVAVGWWGRASEAQTTVSRGWLRKYLGWGENYTALHYSLFKSVGTQPGVLAESGRRSSTLYTVSWRVGTNRK